MSASAVIEENYQTTKDSGVTRRALGAIKELQYKDS